MMAGGQTGGYCSNKDTNVRQFFLKKTFSGKFSNFLSSIEYPVMKILRYWVLGIIPTISESNDIRDNLNGTILGCPL